MYLLGKATEGAVRGVVKHKKEDVMETTMTISNYERKTIGIVYYAGSSDWSNREGQNEFERKLEELMLEYCVERVDMAWRAVNLHRED
jgi:hypothetical protein